MKYREKVVFLEGYTRSMARIQAFQAEYEKWETIGTKITQTYSPTTGGSGNTSKPERAAMEMAEISANIENEIIEACKNRDAIKEAISKCKKMRYADILTYRYISGLSNARIASIIKKEPKTVSNILQKAIGSLDI